MKYVASPMLALSAVRMGVSMPGAATTQGLAPSAENFGEDLWSDLYNYIRRVELESEVLKKLTTCGLVKKAADEDLQSCTKTRRLP